MNYDIIVIGAGVIGSMVARELSRYDLSVACVEKSNDVAMGASKANSGIIHGGYDPEPDTLKAKMNTAGISLLYEAARELNVAHKNNRSMVVAFSPEEEPMLYTLLDRGRENGIYDLEIIDGNTARELEPELSDKITKVLLVKNAGIICPYELTVAAMGNAMDNGVALYRNFETVSITKTGENFEITSSDRHKLSARYIVNCAGVYSGKIAEMIGDTSIEIIPRAGEYMILDKNEGGRVSHTIFQVPTKDGKGILVSPTVDNNLLVGPTASVVPELDYTDTTPDGLDTVSKLSKKSVPNVNLREVITSFSGVRASNESGDFIIEASKCDSNFINVAAIDSPGLTSCVAIAKFAVGILESNGLVLNENKNFDPRRPDMHAFRHMNDEEKDDFIKKNSDYGKIICRCEGVSKGEIIAAIKQNPPALDIDGVKRRTRSGMGRCQGGFCSPYVTKLIAEINGTDVEKVTKFGGRSNIVMNKL